MADFLNIFTYSAVAGLSTIAGVYLVRGSPDWTRRNSQYLISFAVGVIMATALFDLLPKAVDLSPAWPYFTLAAFLLLYLVEFGMNIHYCRHAECEADRDVRAAGRVSAIGIGLHSLLDGFTIGVGFEAGFALGVATSFAVIFHELPEGVFIYTLLLLDRVEEGRATFYSWLVALATPVGAIGTYVIVQDVPSPVLGVLLAVAAGTFIYIAAADLVPETHRRSRLGNGALVLIGVGFVLLLKGLAG